MQRYFFHITDGTRLIDQEGTLLDGVSAAKAEAVHRAGRHLSTCNSTEFWTGDPWVMDCRDDHALILFTLNFHGNESAAIKKQPTIV